MENFNIEDQALEEMIYEFAQSESSPGWDYINNQCSHSGFSSSAIQAPLSHCIGTYRLAEQFPSLDTCISGQPDQDYAFSRYVYLQ